MLSAALVAALLALLVLYAIVERYRFQLTRLELYLPNWPEILDGLTILHLTDFHTRRDGPAEAFVRALADDLEPPDLVVLTGDYAEGRSGLPHFLDAVSALPARLGRYAVLGNNDLAGPAQRDATIAALTGAGIEVLSDRSVRIEAHDAAFVLAGLQFEHVRRAAGHHHYDVAALFDDEDPAPRLLLSHSPDPVPEAAVAGVVLMLCGHTHGGQICLPGGRPVQNNLYRFRPPNFTRGLYQVGDLTVYVNRGLGTTTPCLRTWCPPEAALITLRARPAPAAPYRT